MGAQLIIQRLFQEVRADILLEILIGYHLAGMAVLGSGIKNSIHVLYSN